MPLDDYSLSYTVTIPALYFDNTSGVYGVPATINAGNLISTDNFGVPATIDAGSLVLADVYGVPASITPGLVFQDVYGVPATLSSSGLAQVISILGKNLIHYGEQADLKIDELSFGNNTVIVSASGRTYKFNSNRIGVANFGASGVLLKSQSNALVINEAAVSDPVETALPSGSKNGAEFTFVRTASGLFRVRSDVNEKIALTTGNAQVANLNGIGAKLSLIYDEAGRAWRPTMEDNISIFEDFKLLPELPPNGIANLAAWYDADDSSTITIEPTNNISQWDDKSGFGRDITQTTEDDRPIVASGVQNGLDGIEFDDANTEWLDRAGAIVSSVPLTIFAVMEFDDVAPIQHIFNITDASSNLHYFSFLLNSTLREQARDAGTIATITTSFTPTAGTPIIVKLQETNDSLRSISVNGTVLGTDTQTVNPLGLDTFTIGRLGISAPVRYFSGRMFELAVFSGIPTADEEQFLNNYFTNKWGIVI